MSLLPVWKMFAHSGCSQPSVTRSVTEPPSAKNGLSDSHGSGHWDLASRSASKNFAIRSSRITAAPSV